MALIYHITAAADWAQSVRAGTHQLSSRGLTLAQEGFIHASSEPQVELVATRFYSGVTGLVVLEIDTSLVEPEIRYEVATGTAESFPHIYGPLSPAAVLRVLPLEPDASGRFRFSAAHPAQP